MFGMDTHDTIVQPARKRVGATALKWTTFVLVVSVWISAGMFGLYILTFYFAALFGGNLEQWNNNLPGLYKAGNPAATTGIGVHFATGGIILILGSLQLIEAIRVRYSAFHRWVGRIYVVSALLAAIGGLIFIVAKGTIGGTVMDIGFGLYGVLMFICGVETYRHAAALRVEKHRAWALRLYALAIGSWLYRMDYGFWFFLTDGVGHGPNFTGPFDRIMSFFFFIPNLFVAEVFIRSSKRATPVALALFSSFLIVLLTAFLILGTYYFTKFYWGPAIAAWFMGK